MQRKYELMLVFRPDFGVEEKPIREFVKKLVGDREIKELTVLGKKSLAYTIKKQTEGVYATALIAGAPIKVADVEKQLKQGADVLRFLLIVKE